MCEWQIPDSMTILTKEVFGNLIDFHFIQDGIQRWHFLVFRNTRVIQELFKFITLYCQIVNLKQTKNLATMCI